MKEEMIHADVLGMIYYPKLRDLGYDHWNPGENVNMFLYDLGYVSKVKNKWEPTDKANIDNEYIIHNYTIKNEPFYCYKWSKTFLQI